MAATRFLRRHVFKNPQVTAKVTEVSVCTLRQILNLNVYMPRLQDVHHHWPKSTRKVSSNMFKNINKPEVLRFCSVERWNNKKRTFQGYVLHYIRRKQNEAYAENNTPPTLKHGGGSVVECLANGTLTCWLQGLGTQMTIFQWELQPV